MLSVGENSKFTFHWKVNPYDYSEDKVKDIIQKASKKYNVKKDAIRVVPEFILLNDNGENINISNEMILNIQNPQFQLNLFKEYIETNKIENCDFDFIKKIDSEINSFIDYDKYEKYRRYSVKWVKWSNFLSYGKDNFFDFTTLKDLVLLNGEPANQSGKTTFAIDLMHFLLFGKTDKASTQDKIFNRWLKDETEVVVEGCIDIDGEEYIIKRTLTRPKLDKRTAKSKTTQKVEYYKIINGSAEELEEYIDNQQEENSIKTNKVIKETLGNESDFDLIISATSGNLDDLINKKDTERGRILAKWLGLLPIEKKDEVARAKYNNDIKPYLLSNKYNTENLLVERESFLLKLKDISCEIEAFTKKNKEIDTEIEKLEETRKVLLSAKQNVDETLTKIDINTLKVSIENLTQKGIGKKTEIEKLDNEINGITFGEFSMDEYDALQAKNVELNSKLGILRTEFKNTQNHIVELEKGEYCPTCGRKLDNVDNSKKINELKELLAKYKGDGEQCLEDIKNVTTSIKSMAEARENFDRKSKLTIKKASCQVEIESLRNQLMEKKQLEKEFSKNEETIRKNNEIELNIRNTESVLNNCRNTKESNLNFINNLQYQVVTYNNNIKQIEDTITKIKEEETIVYNWKVYLDMVGKNGISKMVLRKSLPLINAQLTHLLSDICDFTVEISISDKNEINFYIISDGVVSDISSSSGFEKTAAALALRFVLAKNSIIPKPNYIILDEVFGLVADENLDKMKTLMDKIKEEYAFVFMVTHKPYIKEWADTIVTVSKEKHVSSLKVTAK